MVVYENLKDIYKINKSILTIGTFDGIHKGHLAIFEEMSRISLDETSKKVVISFSPHPKTVLNKKDKFDLLIRKNKKIDLCSRSNIDIMVLLPFDEEFSKMKAINFLHDILIKYFNPSFILVGYDHKFGFKREGNYEFLKKNEQIFNYIVKQVLPFKINNMIISSTIIRKYIKNSNIDIANKYLGWIYEIDGVVIKGSGNGKKIGFPTANLKIVNQNICIPALGVYAISIKIDGKRYEGMCNIGHRPTIDESNMPIIEVNIFHIFEDDFYKKTITVEFLKYIRKEKKFNSINELVHQLKLDKKESIKINRRFNVIS